jgi:hypothetical protein
LFLRIVFVDFFLYEVGWEFTHMVFFSFLWFFFVFFPELYLSILFYLYWTGREISFVVFFFRTLWIATVFPHVIFLINFFKIVFINFIIFNIELVKNYNCRFLHETL